MSRFLISIPCKSQNLKFNHFWLQHLQTLPKINVGYDAFNVIKVQCVEWVTMVNISDLCRPSHTQTLSEYRIYATAASRRRQVAPLHQHLLWTLSIFSKSVMVSVGCPRWDEWTRYSAMVQLRSMAHAT